MRLMIHMENPLAVTEGAVTAWENERTVYPMDKRGSHSKPRRTAQRAHLNEYGLIPYRKM
jgi:hypothetical protein